MDLTMKSNSEITGITDVEENFKKNIDLFSGASRTSK